MFYNTMKDMKKSTSYSIVSLLGIVLCVLTVKYFVTTHTSLSSAESKVEEVRAMVQTRCFERHDALRRWAIAVEGARVMTSISNAKVVYTDSTRLLVKEIGDLLSAQNRKVEALKKADTIALNGMAKRSKDRASRIALVNDNLIARHNALVEEFNVCRNAFPTVVVATLLGFSELEPIVVAEAGDDALQFEDFKTPVFDIRKQYFNHAAKSLRLGTY